MGFSKGNYLAMLLIVFVLFLSWLSIIFKSGGFFFKIELIAWLFLGLLAIIFLNGLSSRSSWAWPAFFIFFILNFINLAAIYSRMFYLRILIIPAIVCLIGLFMSAVNIEHEEGDFDYSYEEPDEEVFTNVPEEDTKKSSKKKTSRKK